MGDIEKYVNGIMKLADFSKDNNYQNYVNKKLIELVKYSDENIKECFFSHGKPSFFFFRNDYII